MALLHLQAARQPLTLAELEAACDVALEPAALEPLPQRVVGSVVFYWHTETVAAKRSAAVRGGNSLFVAGSGGAAPHKRAMITSRRRDRSDENLAELQRKKLMIEACVNCSCPRKFPPLLTSFGMTGTRPRGPRGQRSSLSWPRSGLTQDWRRWKC